MRVGQRRLLGKQRGELATEPELEQHHELALILVGRDELENEEGWSVVDRREDALLAQHVLLLLGGDDLLLAHALERVGVDRLVQHELDAAEGVPI